MLERWERECKQKKKELERIQEQYNQLKNRKFVVRRGRNHQIFYKSHIKTIFDYESSGDDRKHDVNSVENRKEQIDYLLSKTKEK